MLSIFLVVNVFGWIVRLADISKDRGYIFTVDGLFELVSGKIASFITKLDGSKNAICVLDSAETYDEQKLIPGARPHAGHCAMG